MPRELSADAVSACADECVSACARIIASHIDAGSERDAIIEDYAFRSIIAAYIEREWAHPFSFKRVDPLY